MIFAPHASDLAGLWAGRVLETGPSPGRCGPM